MTTEQIAYLALMVSILSLINSVIVAHRDRHIVHVRGTFITDLDKVTHLVVSVSNAGKRAISINFVFLKGPGHPGTYITFAPQEERRVDVGESKGCRIPPGQLNVSWNTSEDRKRLKVYVQDAVGKLHKANFSSGHPLMSWLKRTTGWY